MSNNSGTSGNTDFSLLGEITTYNDNKEELYNKLRTTEINNLISAENQALVNDVKSKLMSNTSNDTIFNIFKQFFNMEYENNISIGDYFNDKIVEMNDLLEKTRRERDAEKLKITESEIRKTTTQTVLDNEYNKVVINKIYRHILLIIVCILVLMNLICVLKSYGFIDGYVAVILNIILVLITLIYILSILYTKYPRESNEYHRFRFPLDNENMDRHYTDGNPEPTVDIDAKVDELADENP